MAELQEQGFQLIDRTEVAARLGVHVATVDRMRRKDERFPVAIRIAGRDRWRVGQIADYVNELERRQRDAEPRG